MYDAGKLCGTIWGHGLHARDHGRAMRAMGSYGFYMPDMVYECKFFNSKEIYVFWEKCIAKQCPVGNAAFSPKLYE